MSTDRAADWTFLGDFDGAAVAVFPGGERSDASDLVRRGARMVCVAGVEARLRGLAAEAPGKERGRVFQVPCRLSSLPFGAGVFDAVVAVEAGAVAADLSGEGGGGARELFSAFRALLREGGDLWVGCRLVARRSCRRALGEAGFSRISVVHAAPGLRRPVVMADGGRRGLLDVALRGMERRGWRRKGAAAVFGALNRSGLAGLFFPDCLMRARKG